MTTSSIRAMRRMSRFHWALAAVVVLLHAPSSHAQELVEYQFTGVVTDMSGNLGIFGQFGTVQVNDVFTGRFSYMTGPSNPDQEMNDPQLGVYDVVDFGIDQAVVQVTPFGIGITHRPGLPTLPPLPEDLGTDGFAVAGTFLAGQDTKVVSLRLEAPFAMVFNDDSLPTELTLSDFTDSRVVRSIRVLALDPNGMSQIDEGQLTSLVRIPEPSSIALMLLGVNSAGLLWRFKASRGLRSRSIRPGGDPTYESLYPLGR